MMSGLGRARATEPDAGRAGSMCARPRQGTATVAKVTGAAAAVGSGEHSAGDCGKDDNRALHFVPGLLPHSARAPVGQCMHRLKWPRQYVSLQAFQLLLRRY
jgi:hypothetical protein